MRRFGLMLSIGLAVAAGGAFAADGGQDDFLPVEKAFTLRLHGAAGGQSVIAEFTPAPSYYLYRERLSFALQDGASEAPLAAQLPAGERKTDPNFGVVEVYHKPFGATIRLAAGTGAAPSASALLKIGYQGCSEKGLCYPPVERRYRIAPGAAGAGSGIGLTEVTDAVAGGPAAGAFPAFIAGKAPDAAASTPAPAAPVLPTPRSSPDASAAAGGSSDNARVAQVLGSNNAFLIIVAFFGFGLLLAFTPCVFPMIPILSGIIVGDGAAVTRRRGFLLSVTYVAGMALTYALAGVAAGLSGALLTNALQNAWVLSGFALVFVALAGSMFGFYDIELPGALQNRLSGASNRLSGGRLAGVFAMGALSALIVGPCVAAPLAGALLYIGQTGNVVLGGVALFSMALGMGVPLLLIGASAGALLPRAGAWMDGVKRIFGGLLLAVALWLVSPVLPAVAFMLAAAALLVASGVFLRALDPLPPAAPGPVRLGKSVGVLLLLCGAAQVVGALSGGRDILQPLSHLAGAGSSAPQAAAPAFTRVRSLAELQAQVQAAGPRPVMLDFYADWCVSCKEMERLTFTDPAVRLKLDRMLLLQADVTANNADDKALLKRFGLFGPPGILFFDRQGRELADARIIGYQNAEKFRNSLQAADDARERVQ